MEQVFQAPQVKAGRRSEAILAPQDVKGIVALKAERAAARATQARRPGPRHGGVLVDGRTVVRRVSVRVLLPRTGRVPTGSVLGFANWGMSGILTAGKALGIRKEREGGGGEMVDRQNDARPPQGLPWRDGDDVSRLDVGLVAEHHRVVIDTDSFTNAHSQDVLVGQLLPQLIRTRREAIVSVRTIQALHAQGQSRVRDLADTGQRGMRALHAFQAGCAVVSASDPHHIAGDPLATEALLTELFVGFQQREALCLVTQNEALAWTVLRNARSVAFRRAKPVVAAFVAHDGLRNWAPQLASRPVALADGLLDDEATYENVVKCRIFVDTCSWMLQDKQEAGRARGAEFLRAQLMPVVEAQGNPLMVPNRVRLELEAGAKRAGDQQNIAVAGLEALHEFRGRGLAVLAADPTEVAGDERFADPVFVRLAVRFQNEFDLCFVTQDEELANLLLAHRHAGTGRMFLVVFIPMRGKELVPWQRKLARKRSPAGEGAAPRATTRATGRPRGPGLQTSRKSPVEGFRILTEISRTDPTPLTVSELPAEGGTVVGAKSGPILLGAKIAAGGEGTVYRTDRAGIVCKVYHAACLSQARQAKLVLMTSREVRIGGVCWPHEVVTNSRGEFVGFSMP